MFTVILAVHIALCLFMIVVVLIQQGQGADAGVTFGGGSSSSFFGAGGGVNFFTRLTTAICILFMVTSILLVRSYPSAVMSGGRPAADPLKGSVMGEGVKAVEAEKAPPADGAAAIPVPQTNSVESKDAAPSAPAVEPAAKVEEQAAPPQAVAPDSNAASEAAPPPASP